MHPRSTQRLGRQHQVEICMPCSCKVMLFPGEQRELGDIEKTVSATVSAVEERLGVMMGVPLPTQAERIMEAKRLEMIGVRERMKRTRKLPKAVRKVWQAAVDSRLVAVACSPAASVLHAHTTLSIPLAVALPDVGGRVK